MVREAQSKDKENIYTRRVFERTRDDAKAKKGKYLSHRASVMAEAEAKERAEMAKNTTSLKQRPRPSQRPRVYKGQWLKSD